MNLSEIIAEMKARIERLSNLSHDLKDKTDLDDFELSFYLYEFVSSIPDSDESKLGGDDLTFIQAVCGYLFTFLSDHDDVNPNTAEYLVKTIHLADEKLNFDANERIGEAMGSPSDDDLVGLWVKGAQGRGDEAYGYLLEIYQWLRDVRDEEWAEDFASEHEIDEDDL